MSAVSKLPLNRIAVILPIRRATADDFLIDADLDAFDGERRIFAKRWTETIPRDNV